MAKMNQHIARKRFGQNFLHDSTIINNIIRTIHPKATDNLLEIGPGMGALTKELLASCENLQAIELDRDLIPKLQIQFAEYPNFKIFSGDALKFDFSQVASISNPVRVVGNLPYNISTPLIFHILEQCDLIYDMHFMLQKEVVDRLAAEPNCKNYGRLSVMVQYFCAIEALIDVPPSAFRPAPKVDSSVVRLIPYKEIPFKAQNLTTLNDTVRQAFSQRRKTIRNTLKTLASEELLISIGIDPTLRAENLSVEDFVNISNALDQPLS